jgi:general secretion pathway protein C
MGNVVRGLSSCQECGLVEGEDTFGELVARRIRGGVNHNGRMSARWATFLVWALVAASAAAWGLKLFVTAPTAPPQVAVAGQSQLPRGDITRVLGADAPPPVDPTAGESLASAPADARFQLLGVVAPRGSETARGGVALIAVDGKPAKAFRIGAVVDGENVVQAIRARGADLGPAGGKVTVALNIPPPAPAATGTLPDARAPGGATPAVPASPASPALPGTARALPVAPPPMAAPSPAAARRTAPVTPPAAPLQPLAPPRPVPGQAVPLPSAPGSMQPQIR